MAGWDSLIEILEEAVAVEGAEVSWKEKYGTLSIFIYGGSPGLERLADVLEALSGCICQFCGQTGSLRLDTPTHGWMRTLRAEHSAAIEEGRWWADVSKAASVVDPLSQEEKDALRALLAGESAGAAKVLRTRLVESAGIGPYEEDSLPDNAYRLLCEQLETEG